MIYVNPDIFFWPFFLPLFLPYLFNHRKNETVVTLHANYRKGGELKKKDLETHGYWIARKSPDGSHTDGLCKAFVPTIWSIWRNVLRNVWRIIWESIGGNIEADVWIEKNNMCAEI